MKLEAIAAPVSDVDRAFADFNDPDGNRWLVQEVTKRAPGR
jgi:hypothetical protein